MRLNLIFNLLKTKKYVFIFNKKEKKMNKKVLAIVIGIILVLGGFVIYFKKSDKAV